MITIEQMVQREVLCCMSSLVLTLVRGHEECADKDLNSLCEQASELAAPVLDYEEAAIQAGWENNGGIWGHDDFADAETDAQRACWKSDVEPYEWEVYEHWAVSQWLADKLIAQGERVDTDFAGLNIWARTTTGQAIGMDGCMQRIYADMMAPVGT